MTKEERTQFAELGAFSRVASWAESGRLIDQKMDGRFQRQGELASYRHLARPAVKLQCTPFFVMPRACLRGWEQFFRLFKRERERERKKKESANQIQ